MSEHQPAEMLPDAVEQAAEALVTAWTGSAAALQERVSPSQLRALLELEKHDAMSLGGLGQALGAIPSSVSRLCDRLQASGLVSRAANDANRREITIRLTADGRQLLTTLHTTRADNLTSVLGRMSPASRDALLGGLREFAKAMLARTEQDRRGGS
jgi:DNA-binding MarR family transcriptional regulator